MRKALAALALIASPLALATDLGGDGLGGPSLQPRAQSVQLGEPGIANREVAQVDPVLIEAGEPALDFRFAKNKNLTESTTNKSSLITFSRSAAQSPGTYVGADGLIHDAAVNLALYSDQFDNAAWTKTNARINANQIASPDGKQTADFLQETTANGQHDVRRSTTVASGAAYTQSVYAKIGAGSRRLFMSPVGASGFGNNRYVVFDLSAGTATPDGGGTGTLESYSITNVGNGWYRCSVTVVTAATTAFGILRLHNGSTDFYLGDDTSGIYIWGAQLEETDPATMAPTAYIKTTSQALAAPRFDHDPVTGESLGLLVEEQRTNFFTNSDSLATQNVTTTATAYTLSFYGAGTIDLTGTHTATVVGAGDYPTRTTLTFTPTAGTLTATVTGTVQYAQLEQGAFPTSYIPTTGSSQTRYADVAAVQDEDFSTTNLLAYSESFDVGWALSRIRPVVANATTAPDGQITADYIEQEAGQTAAGAVLISASYTGQQIASVYAKAAEKNFLRITDLNTNTAYFDLQNGVVGTVTGLGAASIEDVGNGWYRCSVSLTYTGSGALLFYLADADNSSTVTDSGGIYLWGASLTATEYPVEYVTTRNLLTDSQDFERGSWTPVNATIGNDVTQSPDATLTADKLEATATGTVLVSGNASVIGSQDYVASFYAKQGTADFVYLREWYTQNTAIYSFFNLSNGTVGYSGAQHTASIVDAGNGWYRVSVTSTPNASRTQALQIGVADVDGVVTGTTGANIYIWGAQLEPGTTATDYVRTVDTVGKAYGFYEPTEGTVFADADKISDYANSAIGSLEADANNIIAFGHRVGATASNTASAWIRNAGATELFRSDSNSFAGWKMSIGFKHNDANISVDGQNYGAADTAVTLPTVSRLQIGRYATVTSYLNGHIRRLTYWPRRQADSTLQVITQ